MNSEPDADKPRIVVDYGGLQIRDSRHHIQLHFTTLPPPPGMRWCMKDAGFTPTDRGQTWIRAHTPAAVFSAQLLGNTFFDKSQEKS